MNQQAIATRRAAVFTLQCVAFTRHIPSTPEATLDRLQRTADNAWHVFECAASTEDPQELAADIAAAENLIGTSVCTMINLLSETRTRKTPDA
jgi:hypothetical protein